jgi:hypothetical protein
MTVHQMLLHIDPNSKLAKIFLVFFFLPLGMAGLWFELVELARCFQSPSWPTSDGVILESRVEKDVVIKGIPHYAPRIRYAYVNAGQRLENNHIGFGLCRGMLTWGFADDKIAKFPKGKAVKVFYNARKTEIACLEPRTYGWEDGFMVLLCLIAIFLGTNELATWFPRGFLMRKKSSAAGKSGQFEGLIGDRQCSLTQIPSWPR